MTIETSRLGHIISMMEDSGATKDEVDRALTRSGLRRSDASGDTNNFQSENEAMLIRHACEIVDDITFGARSALSWRHATTLVSYISKYSKDVRAAVENTSRFYDIVSVGIGWSLRVSGNSASIDVFITDPGQAKYHRHIEFLVFLILGRIRVITGTLFHPIEIRFAHQVKRSARMFQKVAGCPVVFGAESIEIVLPLPALDIPIPTYDLRLREHLTGYGERLLREHSHHDPSLRSRVEGLITSSLPGRMLGADEVSASLGMSPRTFARRLQEEGVTYRRIVDDLRCDLAKTFLKDDMALAEIAFTLAYADQAAFSTAFKRWTGVTPRDFRQVL